MILYILLWMLLGILPFYISSRYYTKQPVYISDLFTWGILICILGPVVWIIFGIALIYDASDFNLKDFWNKRLW